MDIKEAYAELKAIAPKNEYVCLDYTLNRYSNGNEDVECSVYIEGVGEFTAPIFRVALDQAKVKLGLIKPEELNIEG